MDEFVKPDLVAAARHFEAAHTSIKEGIMAICRPSDSAALWSFAGKLSEIAQEFREGRMLGGLRVPLVDARSAARAMGHSRSEKKLAALAKAREALAEKRRLEAERQMIRRRVARHTVKRK